MDVTASWRRYRYAVVDVEGNGQRPPDRVELAAVPVEGGACGPRAWLVGPHRPSTSMARRFPKISDADVADKSSVAEMVTEMRGVLADAVIGLGLRLPYASRLYGPCGVLGGALVGVA